MKIYPFRISLIYFVLATVWIYTSDRFLIGLSPDSLTWAQSVKGFLFVLVTSVIIYFVTNAGYKRITRQELDYKRLFDESPHPIIVYDIETLKIVAANHVFFAKYGYTLQETVHLTILDLCLPEEKQAALEALKAIRHQPASDSGIWPSRNKAGEVFYITLTSYSSTFRGEQVRMVIVTDIGAELKARQALLESEKKLKSLIDNSSEAIFIIDKDMCITTGNLAFEKLVEQIDPELGKPKLPVALRDVPDAIEAASWIEYAQRALKGESIQVEKQYQLSTGETIYYQTVMNPIYDVNNEITGVGCFSRNVTQSKNIKLQLSRQLSQLREIAWIQSHELRRPLANIMGLVSLIEHDIQDPELLKENVELLRKSTNELDEIVKSIVAKSYQEKK
ncbi:PAS domain S-box protein [Filimonas effusa]|uniref:histidine kinase n=1 Tax=Filimonas effusa TaxID=2508721 RepID=A0A4Q1D1V9_9BACT|nr:PAS domain S-box protein [Filimonas effusa]RXK80969.1 PAS domain S-box protein [Filimonas effusa]